MNHTHTLAEWAAFLLLGLGLSSAASVPFWLTYDANLCDFDPRPAVSRVLESGRLDFVLVTVANAKYDARIAARDAAVTGAALLALLLPAPEGAVR